MRSSIFSLSATGNRLLIAQGIHWSWSVSLRPDKLAFEGPRRPEDRMKIC
jgi:hypothetical protein